MGIPAFDLWAATTVIKSLPISCLAGATIGYDATYYLELLLVPAKEPLLSALGGFPLALEQIIVRELTDLKTAGITPYFIFNGLEHVTEEDAFTASIHSARKNQVAFKTYEDDKAKAAIALFRESGAPTPTALAEYLKKLLHQHGIGFMVAPYSSLAQLSYMLKHPKRFIDAVFGPSETLLYGVDKLINRFDLKYEAIEPLEEGNSRARTQFVPESSSFYYIDARKCLEELRIPSNVLIDACLLAGSSHLRPFPPLYNQAIYPTGPKFPDIVNMVMTNGRTGVAVCRQHENDPVVKELNYLDRYKAALTSIKHHVIIFDDGSVDMMDKQRAPEDVHECIGKQRLPEELTMYLSRGMLRPRVYEWLTSGTINIIAPLDGGDSLQYQKLVKDQLEPSRKQAVSMLSSSLTRWYHKRDIFTRVWYDSALRSKFVVDQEMPSKKNFLSSWNVREEAISEQQRKFETEKEPTVLGSLSFAVLSLQDLVFASRTVLPKPEKAEKYVPLKTAKEIVANTVWRFLQLRGYVDKQHQLTHWGKILATTLTAVGATKDQEEAAFLAVDIMRFDLLSPDEMFDQYSGAPLRGSHIDRRNAMLVSRVACLGRLRHQARGYSGPLSRHMLAYHSIISAVQASLRDMLEVALASMFLEGEAERDRKDFMDLSLALPFYDERSCALGIVMKVYLDELLYYGNTPTPAIREEMKMKGHGWVEFADFNGSLEDAFHLWDAVYKGVQAADDEVKGAKVFHEVNEWLADRR